jgi:hypothetical protein
MQREAGSMAGCSTALAVWLCCKHGPVRGYVVRCAAARLRQGFFVPAAPGSSAISCAAPGSVVGLQLSHALGLLAAQH